MQVIEFMKNHSKSSNPAKTERLDNLVQKVLNKNNEHFPNNTKRIIKNKMEKKTSL